MAVKQKQIAEKLGVSITLVSRVLSGKAAEIGIAPATIERVMTTAKEMGYTPNAAALSLKGKPTRTIGVAVYDFNDPFFGALIKEIQIHAHKNEYSLILAGFLNRSPNTQDLHALHKHAIDGLILLGSETNSSWLSEFSHLPIARIGHGAPSEKSIRISPDEPHAAKQLITHLAQRGIQTATFLSTKADAHRLRGRALHEAARTAGIAITEYQAPKLYGFAAGHESVIQLIGAAPLSDALICATDQIAIGALRALKESNRTVPGSIVVTGFDDLDIAREFTPALTTIRQPLSTMVEQAFDAIIHPSEPQIHLITGTLVVRQSA
jgi:LacI family transcriptional regulator